MVMRLLAVAAVLFAASPAAAHAMLEDAKPAVGSRGPAPSRVLLDFDSNVAPAASRIIVQGPQGFGGAGPLQAANAWTLVVSLKGPVPPGRYHVYWEVKSTADGHMNQGDFVFDVRP